MENEKENEIEYEIDLERVFDFSIFQENLKRQVLELLEHGSKGSRAFYIEESIMNTLSLCIDMTVIEKETEVLMLERAPLKIQNKDAETVSFFVSTENHDNINLIAQIIHKYVNIDRKKGIETRHYHLVCIPKITFEYKAKLDEALLL